MLDAVGLRDLDRAVGGAVVDDQPLRVFWTGALILGVAAVAIFIHFLIFFVQHPNAGARHIQELIAGGVLFNAAMLLGALGVIGDLLAAQRTLTQRTFERVRRIELALGIAPSHYEANPAAHDEPRSQQTGDREAVNA